MKQCDYLIALFNGNNGRLTLRQIMQTPLGAEYRARMTDLRHQGYVITCLRNSKSPSDNLYTFYPPEPSGQLRMA